MCGREKPLRQQLPHIWNSNTPETGKHYIVANQKLLPHFLRG
jgi:hypothetical protein